MNEQTMQDQTMQIDDKIKAQVSRECADEMAEHIGAMIAHIMRAKADIIDPVDKPKC